MPLTIGRFYNWKFSIFFSRINFIEEFFIVCSFFRLLLSIIFNYNVMKKAGEIILIIKVEWIARKWVSHIIHAHSQINFMRIFPLIKFLPLHRILCNDFILKYSKISIVNLNTKKIINRSNFHWTHEKRHSDINFMGNWFRNLCF